MWELQKIVLSAYIRFIRESPRAILSKFVSQKTDSQHLIPSTCYNLLRKAIFHCKNIFVENIDSMNRM